jgi:hypothetical protein
LTALSVETVHRCNEVYEESVPVRQLVENFCPAPIRRRALSLTIRSHPSRTARGSVCNPDSKRAVLPLENKHWGFVNKAVKRSQVSYGNFQSYVQPAISITWDSHSFAHPSHRSIQDQDSSTRIVPPRLNDNASVLVFDRLVSS